MPEINLDVGLVASATQVINLFQQTKNPLAHRFKIVHAIAYHPTSKASLSYCFSPKAKSNMLSSIKQYEKILIANNILDTKQALAFLEETYAIAKEWQENTNALQTKHLKELEENRDSFVDKYS